MLFLHCECRIKRKSQEPTKVCFIGSVHIMWLQWSDHSPFIMHLGAFTSAIQNVYKWYLTLMPSVERHKVFNGLQDPDVSNDMTHAFFDTTYHGAFQ